VIEHEEVSEKELDELMRALSHPVRRRILHLTRCERMSAGTLVHSLGLPAATVSEHLKVLRKTGLAIQEREGTWRFYRANAALLAALVDRLNRLT
jgi:DNA-binding transcriptional ArsR family regulator